MVGATDLLYSSLHISKLFQYITSKKFLLQVLHFSSHVNQVEAIRQVANLSGDLMCGCAAVRLLGLRVRIPQGAWMSFSSKCCVLSARGLLVGLITRPEESYRIWCL